MEKNVYEVTFTHQRYTGEGRFFYWVQRPNPTAAIKAAEALYRAERKDNMKSAGAVITEVKRVGSLDA